MALTLGPAGRGANLKSLLWNHAAGLGAGATVAGLDVSLIGYALPPNASDAVLVVAGGAALAWLPRTAGWGFGLSWPRSRWQVPETWRYLLPMPITAFAFGCLLGVGFLTSPVLPVFWLFVALSVAAHPLTAVVSWWGYAAARWAMTARESRRIAHSGLIPDAVHGRRGFRVARSCAVLALAATSAVAVTVPLL